MQTDRHGRERINFSSNGVTRCFDNPTKKRRTKRSIKFKIIAFETSQNSQRQLSLPLSFSRFARFGLFFSIDRYRTNETSRAFLPAARTCRSTKSHPLRFPTIQFNRDWANGSTGAHEVVPSRLDLIESRTVLPEERRPSPFHLIERTSRPHIKQRAAITSGIGWSRRRQFTGSRVNIWYPGGTRDNGLR